jgi:hypothetical protein
MAVELQDEFAKVQHEAVGAIELVGGKYVGT